MAACFHGGPQPTSILSGISSHELGAGLGRKMDVEGGTRAQLKSGTCRIPAPSAAVGVPGPESWRLAQRGSEGNRRGGEGEGRGLRAPAERAPCRQHASRDAPAASKAARTHQSLRVRPGKAQSDRGCRFLTRRHETGG